ncbi:conserved hypothetical protein [Verticillium alfalfae VaMs.102]|uniref:Rhodopsin domain-containing protein n=1 Tax=Verticillium alfalfae (strain VaMs.102 / ATCC MYA-4576 / FGSC 10136) TaxID=526221 RepID=C9SRR5_VERA1|nr:conserved hypothetical protein [Verticillium alfalfae VaMs.102]EEY21480.1 conserved hypothetical protein [Verticillium alfalfae VaMs.102]
MIVSELSLGLGRHFYYVSDSFSDYLKSGLAASLLYTASLFSTKVSILCLYIRIFSYQGVQLLSKMLLAIVVISHTWIITSILTTCVPLDSIWIIEKKPSFCHSFNVFWANAGLNMATDLLIFLLPLPVIFKLRLPRRQKYSLYFVFLLAFGVCVISVVRLTNLLKHEDPLYFFMDVTWTAVPIANLNCIEVHTAIVCACLTTIKPLLVQWFPFLLSSRPPASPMTYPVPRYDRPLTIGTQITRHIRPPRYSFVSSVHTSDFKYDTTDEGDSQLQLPIFAPGDGDGRFGGNNSYHLVDLERDGSLQDERGSSSRPTSSRPSSWPIQSLPPRAITPEWPLKSPTSRSGLIEERESEEIIAVPEITYLREGRLSHEVLQEYGHARTNMHGWI